ncbi:MAG: hypothetical protein ACI9EK_001139 [Psychroserpens sp.]|jgi:hypothetical protein
MKKITFLFTLLLTITLSFGQELITNGDFESGVITPFTGGSLSFNAAGGNLAPARANLGNEAANIRQNIVVVAGVEYTVSFWWRFNVGTSTTSAFAHIQDQADDSDILPLVILPFGTDVWTNTTFTFTSATATALYWNVAKFTRNSVNPISTNNAMWFDDISIVPTSSLSVSDLAKFNFNAYPNPAKDIINLSAAKNIDKIEIYTPLGQQVKSINLNSNSAKVNVSGLSKGVYLVKTFIEDAVGTYKFVKE